MKLSQKLRSFTKAMITRKLDFEFDGMPFHLDNVSQKKLLTIVRSTLNCAKSQPSPPWYPVQLQIEPSSACMLKCPLCPAATDAMETRHRLMPTDMFRSILDEVGDHASIAILWMWGEPLMNPALPEMISYARQKNLSTLTSTNGHTIQSKEAAERLVASGLDILVVALDGATQETYSSFRVGGDIRKVFKCLELIHQAKDSLGSTKPLVNVRTVVSRQNEGELEAIEEIARAFGADMVAKKSMAVCNLSGEQSGESFAPTDQRYIRGVYRNGRKASGNLEDLKCRRSWNRMTINSAGIVLPCEFDFDETASFGNGSIKGTFLETWRGKNAELFRGRFLENKSLYGFCQNCTYKDSGNFDCTVDSKLLNSKL